MNAPSTAVEQPLRAYAARVASEPGLREAAAVSLVRLAGFTNQSMAASGHALLIDEPVDFGGTGGGPDPAETLLAAVGASLSVTLTAHAALGGLHLSGVDADLSAWMSARSFFVPGGDDPIGVQDATIRLTLTSTESERRLRRLVRDALVASPVVRSLKRRPRVALTVARPA